MSKEVVWEIGRLFYSQLTHESLSVLGIPNSSILLI